MALFSSLRWISTSWLTFYRLSYRSMPFFKTLCLSFLNCSSFFWKISSTNICTALKVLALSLINPRAFAWFLTCVVRVASDFCNFLILTSLHHAFMRDAASFFRSCFYISLLRSSKALYSARENSEEACRV